MLPESIDGMLIRYFSGQLADSERAAFEAWIAEDPAREVEVQRLRDLWEASAEVTGQVDTEAALRELKERLDAGRLTRRRNVAPTHPVGRAIQPGAYAWRIAAAIARLLGGGAAWFAVRSRAPVYLDGDAYFEVAHDHKRPFRVHTGNAVTEVIGTKFGVRAREGESAVQVAVAEGRVALSSPGPLSTNAESGNEEGRAVLERGDVGRLASDGRASVAHGIDVSRILAWTEGRLAFERTPLPEVLAELDRWFDRDFVLGDSSLAGLKLTTSLRGDSLAEAIAVLEAALAVKARVVGRTVILKR